jgi:hypothetical protein
MKDREMKKPFNRLPKGIERVDLSGTQWRVYIALVDHANYETGRARVRHATIAERVGCSVRSVDSALARLKELGLVESRRTGRSSLFRIVFEWQESADQIRENLQIRSAGSCGSTEQEDSNENDLNKNLSLPASDEATDSQTETAVRALEEGFPEGQWEEEREGATAESEAVTDERAHQTAVAATQRTSLSGLPPEKAKEMFSPENYNPTIAAAEQAALNKALGQSVSAEKMAALGKARTPMPIPFPTNFDPKFVGYSKDSFEKEFSLIDYDETLNSFIAYSSTRSEKSQNWLGKFLTYAATGQRQARERQGEPEKEPVVNKAVSWDSRRKEMWKKDRKPGEGYAAWQARKRSEGVDLP